MQFGNDALFTILDEVSVDNFACGIQDFDSVCVLDGIFFEGEESAIVIEGILFDGG